MKSSKPVCYMHKLAIYYSKIVHRFVKSILQRPKAYITKQSTYLTT